MRASLIIVIGVVALALLGVAHAQAPAPFCMPQSTVQTIAAALQQDAAVMALLQEAASEPQRTAKAVADAVAAQKAEDAKAKQGEQSKP